MFTDLSLAAFEYEFLLDLSPLSLSLSLSLSDRLSSKFLSFLFKMLEGAGALGGGGGSSLKLTLFSKLTVFLPGFLTFMH